MDDYLPEIMWGYASSDDDEYWRAAESLEDAVEKALELAEDDELDEAWVCAGQYPDPVAAAVSSVDLTGLLEQMDEWAGDNAIYSGDDPLFEATDFAEEELEKALTEWARKYVVATAWSMSGEPIRIRRIRV